MNTNKTIKHYSYTKTINKSLLFNKLNIDLIIIVFVCILRERGGGGGGEGENSSIERKYGLVAPRKFNPECQLPQHPFLQCQLTKYHVKISMCQNVNS